MKQLNSSSDTLTENWNEIHDGLSLALDQLNTGPDDYLGLKHFVENLGSAFNAAQTLLEQHEGLSTTPVVHNTHTLKLIKD